MEAKIVMIIIITMKIVNDSKSGHVEKRKTIVALKTLINVKIEQ